MYKVGKDTCAVTMLLLHGASRLSLDGYGSIVLPEWCHEAQRAELLPDLRMLGDIPSYQVLATGSDLAPWLKRFALPLLGITLSERTDPQSYAVPTKQHKISWTHVAYRLTLGWCHTIVETGETEVFLVLERFEVAGHAKVGAPRSRFEDKLNFSITLFFAGPPRALPSATRADPDLTTGLDIKTGVDRPKQELVLGSGAASSTSEIGSAHSKTVTASDTNLD